MLCVRYGALLPPLKSCEAFIPRDFLVGVEASPPILRRAQVAMVKHQREEDGLSALARIFRGSGSKSESKRKRWSLARSSRSSSFTAPELHETLKPSPSFKERRNLRRWAQALLHGPCEIWAWLHPSLQALSLPEL